MTALDFLKSKGLIKDGFTELVMRGDFGEIELTKLLEEYKQEQLTSADVVKQSEQLPCECPTWCTGQDSLKEGFKCNNKFANKG